MALILLVLGSLGIGVVAVSWWSWPNALGGNARSEFHPAEAVVIDSAPCGTSTEGDLVEVRVGGETRRARFDGCGHLPGQKLAVRVPAASGENLVVRPAERPSSGLSERVTWVLLSLSGVAGGGYAMLLRSGRSPASDDRERLGLPG
ncbi:hypothetical protein [Parasphingorhabdus pacifica]